MTGIVGYGAYIPLLRLSRDAIAQVWGGRSTGGERSVANHDEDSVTMAVEAVNDCLQGVDGQKVEGLYFASTSSPYKEKQCSSLIAAAADFKREIFSADYANSLRAGTQAMRAARDAVSSGSANNVLVVGADCRLGLPQSAQEQGLGDAAAALLIGNSGVIATIKDVYSTSDEITDVWRTEKDTFVQSWEERWVVTEGYTNSMRKAATGIMKKHELTAKDFAKAVFYAPDARSQRDLAQGMGFDAKAQLQDPMLNNVGNSGTAQPLLMLAAALDEAKRGDRILLVSYGQGSDALILEVTEEIEKLQGKRKVKDWLESKRMLPTYGKYLIFRQLIEQPAELFNIDSAATYVWRTASWVYGLHGSKCRRCGTVAFPIQRICYTCQSKDDYDEVRLADKKGKVFSYSLDNLAGGPDAVTVHTMVESEEGAARIYCLMTDCDPQEIKVDMPVEMTFRRLRESRGYYDYFWKCRPIR